MKPRELRIQWVGATGVAVGALLLATVPLLLATRYSVGALLMAGVDLAALLLVLVDAGYARERLRSLDLAWQVPSTLVVGRPAALTLLVRNPEPEPFDLLVQPRWPEALAQGSAPLELALASRGTIEAPVAVLPMEAGEHHHGLLGLRVEGPLGFAFVDAEAPAPETAVVGPEVFSTARGRRARPPRLQDEGSRTVAVKAPEGERAAARLFEPGDPLRAVDWKSTARRRRLVVRDCEPERRRRAVLALECGRGMAWQQGGRSLYTEAVGAVLGLARRLVDEGCTLEVVAFDGRIRVLARDVASRRALGGLGASLANLRPSAEEPDARLVDGLLRRHRRGLDRLVLVSALPAAALRAGTEALVEAWARRHPVSLVQLRADRHRDAPALRGGDEPSTYRAGLRDLGRAPEVILERRLAQLGVQWIGAGPAELPGALLQAVSPTPPATRPGGRRRHGRA